jgi:hypothetical protein
MPHLDRSIHRNPTVRLNTTLVEVLGTPSNFGGEDGQAIEKMVSAEGIEPSTY